MSEIQGIARLKIHPNKLEEFKRLAGMCMESVRTRDTGTLQYELFFSDDSECVVHERYRDSDALLEHIANLGDTMDALLQTCSISGEILGTPSPELMKVLEGSDVRVYSPYQSMGRADGSTPTPDTAEARKPVVLAPGQGREYPMGRISAVFKADGPETESRYSVSEWWLEPRTEGPGAHSHAEDDLFYVIEGTMSVQVGDEWIEAARGSFVLVPGGVTHGFENRGSVRAGVLNFSTPGPFEPEMPGIAEWFARNPPKDTGA